MSKTFLFSTEAKVMLVCLVWCQTYKSQAQPVMCANFIHQRSNTQGCHCLFGAFSNIASYQQGKEAEAVSENSC